MADFYILVPASTRPFEDMEDGRVFMGVRLVLDSFEPSEEHEESIHNTEEIHHG